MQDSVKESASNTTAYTSDLLYVDDREPEKIFKLLDKRNIKYQKAHLPVGDFIFNDWVFERKAINDFYGSIIDNRLFEQAENMRENFDNSFLEELPLCFLESLFGQSYTNHLVS